MDERSLAHTAHTVGRDEEHEGTIEAQYAGLGRLEETPHFCYDGWVFLGYEDEDGECVELVEWVPCRRCHLESL